MKKIHTFIKSYVSIFNKNNLMLHSAALSYYVTMSVFPILLVLYALLGDSYFKALQALDFVSDIIPPTVYDQISDFLNYVAINSSNAMFFAGITLVLTSSAAALRSVETTIGLVQGGTRFHGLFGFLLSFVISLTFVMALYFAIIVMFTGKSFLLKLNGIFPFLDLNMSWNYIRFVLLAILMFFLFWILFEFSKRATDRYKTFPGAIFATLASVAVSILYSVFISASVNYSLVYGSLASIILLMFWLYSICATVYCGVVLNICIRDFKNL